MRRYRYVVCCDDWVLYAEDGKRNQTMSLTRATKIANFYGCKIYKLTEYKRKRK